MTASRAAATSSPPADEPAGQAAGGLAHSPAARPAQLAPFVCLAYLLGPEDGSAALVEATPEWAPLRAARPGASVMWGRLPTLGQIRLGAIRGGIVREAALLRVRLSPPADLRVRRVHRVDPPMRRGLVRQIVRRALLGGAVVELSAGPRGRPLLAAVAAAAGVRAPRRVQPRVSGDGSVIAHVEVAEGAAELRVARIGGLKAPARGFAALTALESAGQGLVPRPLAAGTVAEAAWTTETRVAGIGVRRLTDPLRADVFRAFGNLPRSPEPPRSPADRIEELTAALPDLAAPLAQLRSASLALVPRAGSVLVHGDLWPSNLLEQGGRLSGVIDWDNWHPSGVPGSDIIQLFATSEVRNRESLEFGALWTDAPWSSDRFRAWSAAYWGAVGVEPDEAILTAAALDWWLTQLSGALRRGRQPARDPAWVERNVTAVLQSALARVGAHPA